MFKEERRGYNIEILTSSDDLEPSRTAVFSAEVTTELEENREILLIDGEVIPHLKSSDGYQIYYQPPMPDLPSAARSYVDTQPEK